jgi:hypothetical protein
MSLGFLLACQIGSPSNHNREMVMAAKKDVKASVEPTRYRLSATERRAARLAEIANKQADLKREAAERRAKRAKSSDTV